MLTLLSYHSIASIGIVDLTRIFIDTLCYFSEYMLVIEYNSITKEYSSIRGDKNRACKNLKQLFKLLNIVIP